MRAKHQRTLEALFEEPTRANVPWREIEALLRALGGEMSEGRGSRVRVSLHDEVAVFHRPHPGPETPKPLVRAVRRFLVNAGVEP